MLFHVLFYKKYYNNKSLLDLLEDLKIIKKYNAEYIYTHYTYIHTYIHIHTYITSQHSLLGRNCGYKISQVTNEVVTESVRVGYTVNIGAFWAETQIRKMIENEETNEEQETHDWKSNHDETELFDTIPFAHGDIGNKDEG